MGALPYPYILLHQTCGRARSGVQGRRPGSDDEDALPPAASTDWMVQRPAEPTRDPPQPVGIVSTGGAMPRPPSAIDFRISKMVKAILDWKSASSTQYHRSSTRTEA